MGVHWKILFLGGFMKNQYIGGLHKGGAWTVCRLKKGAWPKRGRVFLWRVATPMHTMGEVGGMGGFKIWGDLSNGGLILKWGGGGGGRGVDTPLWTIYSIWTLSFLNFPVVNLTNSTTCLKDADCWQVPSSKIAMLKLVSVIF